MYSKIRIFHLLTHTSGIRPDPGIFMEPYPRGWEWFESKDWVKEALRDFAVMEPGKEWRYCSTGFAMLGEIVSRISGIPYEEYVIEKIAKPLGMNTTFFDVPEELHAKICFLDTREEEWFNKRDEKPERAAPRAGGGLYSTLEDMQKFGQMLLNKGSLNGTSILSRKTVEAMTRNHLK